MIEYLEKLVEDKEYEKALAYAEQLLTNPNTTPHDMLTIYRHVFVARFEIGETYGAQVAGELAAQIAQELKEWDSFGDVTVKLGTAHTRLRQLEKALASYYDYLTHVPFYDQALELEPTALYNIGLIHNARGERDEALHRLQQAEEAARRAKNERQAHGIRHALIGAYLQYDRFEEIPVLLAKCAAYLRRHPEVADHHASVLWHHVLRSRYAMATHRMTRALRITQRGLSLSREPQYQHRFHMLIARIHENQGRTRLALAHGMQARAAAIEARRYDLEYDAGLYMYGLLAAHPDYLDAPSQDYPEEWITLVRREIEEG